MVLSGMIKQFIGACLIGCVAVLYYLQYDPWFKSMVAQRVCNQLSTALDCRITYGAVAELQIFSGSITLESVVVTAPQGTAWHWHAQSFTLSLSWAELILYGTIDLVIALSDFTMESVYHHSLAIEPHLRTLFFGPQVAMPVMLKQLSMHRARMRVYNEHNKTLFTLDLSGQLKKIHNAHKAIVRINDGMQRYDNRLLYSRLNGTIEINASGIETHPHVLVGGSCSMQIPYLDAHHMQCHIAGNWYNSQGALSIKNSDHSFDITARVHDPDISVTARAPLSMIWRWLYNAPEGEWLTGTCQLYAKGNLEKEYLRGHILCKEVAAAGASVGSLGRITFDKSKHLWSGTLYGQRKSGIACSGAWNFDQSLGNGSVRMVNDTAWSPTPSWPWSIPAHAGEIKSSFNLDGRVRGRFRCAAQHAKLRTQLSTDGTIDGRDGQFVVEGSLGHNYYHAIIASDPTIQLQSAEYLDPQKKALIKLHTDAQDRDVLSGIINFGSIREALNVLCAYDLQGEGYFNTRIHKQSNGLELSLELVDGTIRLPQTYNFISSFCAKLAVDWLQQHIVISDVHCQLHRGTLHSSRALIRYSTDGSLSFVYAPLLFQDCLLNIQKDLFTIVSGQLVIQQSLYGMPQVHGMVILDRSQLNENLFSYTAQESLMRNAKNMFITSPADMGLDITVLTSHPVHVKTPFLETDARLRVAISNTLRHPNLTGNIHLNAGELMFPYKPLYISKGTIYFMPNQLYDPMIELEARNTIKKFNVSLHVNGSLQNHHISLNASPALSEEQIVALLLVGSQEESLNIVMPALIMQNIKQLIFGSEHTRNKIERYFVGFLKPLKHISLVPSFVDQTGRGGLRGAVEINVHDRLRALIQKNFSLTEDTRFEVEYLLSDDISLRGVRDERRDISGELEMRWKF